MPRAVLVGMVRCSSDTEDVGRPHAGTRGLQQLVARALTVAMER